MRLTWDACATSCISWRRERSPNCELGVDPLAPVLPRRLDALSYRGPWFDLVAQLVVFLGNSEPQKLIYDVSDKRHSNTPFARIRIRILRWHHFGNFDRNS